MQATVAPARTAPAGEGKQKPSLLSTLSLVRRGGDLFAKSKASSPTSCSTLLPSPSQSPATFVLLDALTLKLRSTLIVRDDRDSDTSIDLESEGELEELHEQLVATIEEGKQVGFHRIVFFFVRMRGSAGQLLTIHAHVPLPDPPNRPSRSAPNTSPKPPQPHSTTPR